MKRRVASILLSMAMVATMVPANLVSAAPKTEETAVQSTESQEEDSQEENLGMNVATRAKASASYTNRYYIDPASMNDGKLATSDSSTSWNSWGGSDENYPVTTKLTWDSQYTLTGMRIIWWADNATANADNNVTWPKTCKVSYKDADGNVHEIQGMIDEKGNETDNVGVERDTSSNNGINGNNKYWNYVKFSEPIVTDELSLSIERNGTGTNGVGISEWEVFGIPPMTEGENVASKATVTPSYTNVYQNEETAKAAVTDGELGTNDPATTWNTYGCDEYPATLEFDWGADSYEVNSLRVMWWSDGGGVAFPKDCSLQAYNSRAKRWEDITDLIDESGTDAESVGVKYGTEEEAGTDASEYTNEKNRYWNGVILKEPVTTSKIRLVMDRNGSGATGLGLSEVEIYGSKKESGVTSTNVATKAKASADAQNTPVTNVNNGQLATGASSSWNTWNSNTYPTPVTLTWDASYELTGMRVMYWSDYADINGSAGVAFPKSCTVQYYDYEKNDWETIDAMTDETGADVSSVGVKYGSADKASDTPGSYLNGNNRYWNTVTFKEPVKSTKLRMLIDRHGSGAQGIGIGEWEVFGEEVTSDWNQLVAGQIDGKDRVQKGQSSTYTATSLPEGLDGITYSWSLGDNAKDVAEIDGAADGKTVKINATGNGKFTLNLSMSHEEDGAQVVRTASKDIQVDGITAIEPYVTATAAGTAPILPKMVVADGLTFDDSTPSVKGNNGYDFGEDFNSKLVPVEWEKVDPALYAKDQTGKTFEVKGTVTSAGETYEAVAKITVNKPVVVAEANSTVTFENVQLTDNFWNPKQKVNAVNSLNKAIYQIEQASGGEPNFENAIKRLNGEPYDSFQGYVFQDSDIYKSIEAISYTLSVINDDTDEEMVAQKKKLEEKLAYWISLIEQVQYPDGYINTHFALRSQTTAGGTNPGTHRWRSFANHEMYNAGHFLESVVAYTRYREGIGKPDYSLYVVGKRFADEIVSLFGPDGTRHEVPGHEEIELALVKFSKLVNEYEGEGTGQKYVDTAKTLIDRRGESASLRESGYKGGEYSQDQTPIVSETNGVGHAVRACYYYAGVTDVATLLPEGDESRDAYLNTMDNIWDSVANKKTYITGGIGVASHGEDFGGDYELPSNNSYCEICASIALANWNQRMNLIHEDAKYADVVEKTLYNAILVGTNLTGDKFYYSTRLETASGNARSDWFACACCPPNLMRTIAKLSEYMYTVHNDDLFVNLYIGSDGSVNVGGTKVELKQETEYPWNGAVKMTVSPEKEKEFAMKIRIPGWVNEQKDDTVEIKVNGEAVKAKANKGYVTVDRTWKKGDVVEINMPMEIRKTEANPNVTTNTGKIALERGPIVYAMEKAGNAQMNSDISNFKVSNLVISRDADLKAEYNKDLLNGVVEITGTVQYSDGGTMKDVKVQAIPYYAWNNRGDNGVEGQNNSSQMQIWTNTSGTQPEAKVTSIEVTAPEKTTYNKGEELDLTGMKVVAKYSDGTIKDVNAEDCEVTGFDSEKAGKKVITVTYEGKSATFEVTVKKAEAKMAYEDVKEGAWYYDAVAYVFEHSPQLMTGLDANHFGPDQKLARAQFALILYRMNGSPKVEGKSTFKDVADNDWYTNAVIWANKEGIVTGYTDSGLFGPGDDINREQMAVMMYRYAKYAKCDTDKTEKLDSFKDGAKVNKFAKEAMEWAVGNGIISGKDNGTTLDPQGNATRAECATIMMRFCETYNVK